MRIEYLRTVTTPEHLAGQPGQSRDLPDEQAWQLVQEDYATITITNDESEQEYDESA